MAGPLDTSWGSLFGDAEEQDRKRQEEQEEQQAAETGGTLVAFTKAMKVKAGKALCEHDRSRSGIGIGIEDFVDTLWPKVEKHYLKLVDIVLSTVTEGTDGGQHEGQGQEDPDASS